MTDLCHCGKELHYTKEDTKKEIERLIKKMGRFIEVTCQNITYLVDRHYIALHGLNAVDLPTLGFQKKEN